MRSRAGGGQGHRCLPGRGHMWQWLGKEGGGERHPQGCPSLHGIRQPWAQGLQRRPEEASAGLPEASSPFSHGGLAAHHSCSPDCALAPKDQRTPQSGRSLATHVRSRVSFCLLLAPNSGTINPGGGLWTWFLGGFVFWQAVLRGGVGWRGSLVPFFFPFFCFFLFRRQTNDENPAIGAREPGARLLGGR